MVNNNKKEKIMVYNEGKMVNYEEFITKLSDEEREVFSRMSQNFKSEIEVFVEKYRLLLLNYSFEMSDKYGIKVFPTLHQSIIGLNLNEDFKSAIKTCLVFPEYRNGYKILINDIRKALDDFEKDFDAK